MLLDRDEFGALALVISNLSKKARWSQSSIYSKLENQGGGAWAQFIYLFIYLFEDVDEPRVDNKTGKHSEQLQSTIAVIYDVNC